MSKRTILTSIGTYVGKRGDEPLFGAFGYKGDEVDVHDDFLEEFDRVNVENGTGEEITYERVGVSMISPLAAAQAPQDEEEDEEEAPKAAAKKAPVKR